MWKTYGYGDVPFDELEDRLHKAAHKGQHDLTISTEEAISIIGASYNMPSSSGAADVRRRIFESVEIEEQTGKEEVPFGGTDKNDIPF